jgi:hypothetical protein
MEEKPWESSVLCDKSHILIVMLLSFHWFQLYVDSTLRLRNHKKWEPVLEYRQEHEARFRIPLYKVFPSSKIPRMPTEVHTIPMRWPKNLAKPFFSWENSEKIGFGHILGCWIWIWTQLSSKNSIWATAHFVGFDCLALYLSVFKTGRAALRTGRKPSWRTVDPSQTGADWSPTVICCMQFRFEWKPLFVSFHETKGNCTRSERIAVTVLGNGVDYAEL